MGTYSVKTERRQFPPLKHWRDIRDKVWGVLALLLAVVAIGKPGFHAAQATEQIVQERYWVSEDMRRSTFNAEQLAEIVTACMQGRQWIWQDPHTDSDYAAFCHVVELGKVGR